MTLKILWFSNITFSSGKPKATGTWLYTMAEALVREGVELYNITQRPETKTISYVENNSVKQWILPAFKLHDGLPSKKNIFAIKKIVDDVKPDIIHVWGIESYWGLLTARGYIKGNVLLEIQGIRETCVRVFYGGMSIKEILSTIRTKEFLKPSISLPYQKMKFDRWSCYEREIISNHQNITTQSDWVRSWIAQFVSPKCNIYQTDLIIRNEFMNATPWQKPCHQKDAPVVFTISSEAHAFKGLHDGIRSLAILRKYYPNIQLRIAGNFETNRSVIFKNGYTKYILKLINKLDLENNVCFIGALDAEHIIKEMKDADLMFQTSYVESYSLALVESMAVGLPSVVSYAGAMPELAKDNETALFYTPSNYYKLAYQAKRLIDSESLSLRLSTNARQITRERNNAAKIVANQLEIYKNVSDC